MKEYDTNVLYHSDKANVAADALSRLSMRSVAHAEDEKKELVHDVQSLARLGVYLMNYKDGGVIVQNDSKSSLLSERERQSKKIILVWLN